MPKGLHWEAIYKDLRSAVREVENFVLCEKRIPVRLGFDILRGLIKDGEYRYFDMHKTIDIRIRGK